MKIKYLIPVLLIFSILIILVFAYINWQLSKKIKLEIVEINTTTQLTNDVATLQSLTLDYLINPTESTRKEWWIKHDDIDRLLVPSDFEAKEEDKIITKILKLNQSSEENFLNLIRSDQRNNNKNGLNTNFQIRQNLTQSISSETKEMLNLALNLNQIAEIEIINFQKYHNILNNALYAIIFFTMIASANIGISRIILPITKLHYAADLVAKGNLEYKINSKSRDEIGQLSRAFDEMGTKLKNSYSDLEQKIVNRTLELAKSKAEAEAILTSMGDAVMACDNDGRIMLLNHVALSYASLSLKDAIGKPYGNIIKFVREGTDEPVQDLVAKVIKERRVSFISNNISIIKKDGTKIPIADSAAPIFNDQNEISGCVVVFRDVTKEREVDRAKTEFVALASHQLRTPLASINWVAEMMLGKDFGVMTPKQREMTNVILQSGRRMSDLISALLNTSRLELGTFLVNVKSVDINQIVSESLQDLKPIIKTKKIKIVQEYSVDELTIDADRILLKIILLNLISNAIRYTFPKTTVTIKIWKDKEHFNIIVSDQGIGIPKADQPQIFQKLFRASNAQNVETDGTGLGLYMIKVITSMFGGSINFESSGPYVVTGKNSGTGGTVFNVRIPISGMKAAPKSQV